jgi:hypothetical protein
MKRPLAYQICYVIAATAAFTGAALAAGIATIQDVQNEGYRTPPGQSELGAKPADELVQNEALRTDEESVIHVRFLDGSELSVEALSQVVLSDYVFDGSASSGLINLNDGLFHFTSNGNNDQGVRLRTPVATIGVRGTDFLVHVDGDEATIVDILEGKVEATPVGSGRPITCEEGQSILVAGPDEDALCGDIGSFSTAAGPSNSEDGPEPGQGGQGREREQAHLPPADSSSSSSSSSGSSSGDNANGTNGSSSGDQSSGSSGQSSGNSSGGNSSSSGSSGDQSSGSSGQTSGGTIGSSSGDNTSGSSGQSSGNSSGGNSSSSGSSGTSGQSSGSSGDQSSSGNSSGGNSSSSGSSGTSGQSSGSSGSIF